MQILTKLIFRNYSERSSHRLSNRQHAKESETDGAVLTTCNQFNPAQYNPDIFQPVEAADEEVSVSPHCESRRSERTALSGIDGPVPPEDNHRL
jgi:hypothetical protein